MVSYALNQKCYVEREGKVTAKNNLKVNQGFIIVIQKMYTLAKETII